MSVSLLNWWRNYDSINGKKVLRCNLFGIGKGKWFGSSYKQGKFKLKYGRKKELLKALTKTSYDNPFWRDLELSLGTRKIKSKKEIKFYKIKLILRFITSEINLKYD